MSTPNHPLTDITKAIIAKLRVTAVLSLATGGVKNELPQPPEQVALPAVRVSVRGTPTGPINGASIWDCEAEVDVYSSYAGDSASFGIANEVLGLLNLQPLVVDGWDVITMSLVNMDPNAERDEEVNGKKVKVLPLPFFMQVVAA